MNILIVDDHAIVRRGIRDVLDEGLENVVVFEAGTGRGALHMIEKDEFGLIILDIHLPDRHGLDVLKDIKVKQPALPVIVLSLYPEEHYALRAIRAGASSYLTKESAPEELVFAVKRVLQGRKYVSQSVGEKLADSLAGQVSDTPHDRLSDRELEVLRLISKGKSVSEIGEHLCLSVKTVSTYRARILEKLDLSTTPELMRYAVDHQIE